MPRLFNLKKYPTVLEGLQVIDTNKKIDKITKTLIPATFGAILFLFGSKAYPLPFKRYKTNKMINQNQNLLSVQNDYSLITMQNYKTGKIRLAIALAILGIYLGSLIIAGIHQLL